jgi:hypothetical protein
MRACGHAQMVKRLQLRVTGRRTATLPAITGALPLYP